MSSSAQCIDIVMLKHHARTIVVTVILTFLADRSMSKTVGISSKSSTKSLHYVSHFYILPCNSAVMLSVLHVLYIPNLTKLFFYQRAS